MSTEMRIPYPGLRAFESSESDLFFGRDGCVDAMLQLLARTRLLAVLGTSGSGKSSLVRTGLIDSLELGFLVGAGSRWMIADMHPGGRPIRNLAKALLKSDGADEGQEKDLLESFLARGPRSLVQWCGDGNLPEDTSLLLLVDQFEELFRYQDYAGQEQAEAFVALLLECATSKLPIYVVLTMRSEFLGACALMPGLAEKINESLYLTRRMTRDECKQAIEGPAAVLDFKVEPKLVTRILNDLATFAPWDSEAGGGSLAQLARRADQLPLMQHVLNRLWMAASARGGDCVLRYDDYEIIGGLRGAIDAHGEEITNSLPEAVQDEIENVFRALVSGNSITDAVRNPRKLGELTALSEMPDRAVAVVDAFRAEGCNFLRPAPIQKVGDSTIIDLGHESLIRQWSAMEGWLKNESRSRAAWRRLVTAAEAHTAGEGDLLSGLDLENARDWWEREEPSAAWAADQDGDYATTKRFLDRSVSAEASRQEAEAAQAKRAQRSLRMRAAAYLGLAVISVGAALYAFDAQNDALHARNAAQEAERSAIASRDEAERQRASAEEAQEQTIKAADKFLVDFASRLRRTIGVPEERVAEMFTEAEAFLDEIEAKIDDPSRLYTVRASLALERAGDLWDRAEHSASLDQAALARHAIESAKEPADYSGDDVDLLLRTMSYVYSDQVNQDRDVDAAATRGKAQALFAEYRERMDDDDALYWQAVFEVEAALERARADLWAGSLDLASECLATLSRVSEKGPRALDLQLSCTGRQLAAATELDSLTPDLFDRAERALVLISPEEKSRGDWSRWAWVQRLLADAAHTSNDPDRGDRISAQIVERLEELAAIEPGEDSWRVQLAGVRQNRGYQLGRSRDFERAFEEARKSAELYKGLAETFEVWRDRARNYHTVLNNLDIYSGNMEKQQKDPAFLAELVDLHEERLRNLDFMVEKGIRTDCQGCTFDPLNDLVHAHGKRIKLGEVESGDLLLDAYDRLADRTWDHLDVSRTDLEARRARLYLAEATANLVVFVSDAFGELPDEDAERLSADVVPRLTRYLEQFPRDGATRQLYGNFLADRAVLQDRMGLKDLAVLTMKDAMTLGSHDAVQRMAAWYRSGEGPVETDPNQAAELDLQLDSLAPGPFNILLKADNLFTEEVESHGHHVNLFLPTQPGLSPVEEVIWRARTLAGIEVHPDEIAQLWKAEEAAVQNETSFTIEAAKVGSFGWLDHVFSADAMVAFFYQKIEEVEPGEEPDGDAIQIFSGALGMGLDENVRQAIQRIVRNRAYPRYDDAMDRIVELPGGLRGHIFPQFQHLGEPFLDILRRGERFVMDVLTEEFDNMDRKHVAQILSKQGSVYFWWGNETQRQSGLSDMLAAIKVAPDDADVLHFAGYAALDFDHLRSFAVEWTERARDLVKPGSEEEEDSRFYLGYAYVLNDRAEEGVALIQQGIELGGEASGEAYYHLAEGFRRLGRIEDALTAAGKMTGHLGPAQRFEEKARKLLERLEPARNHTPSTLEAAKKILAELTDTELDRKNISLDRVGIAIRGYDPVAFHVDGTARIGRLEHYVIEKGAVWLFASAENRAEFVTDVERYIPVAGGFKAMVGQARANIQFHAQPENWRIAEGRVFFLHSEEDRKEFDRKGAEHAQRLLLERSRVNNEIEIGPSPPSIYEHLLLRLSTEVGQR